MSIISLVCSVNTVYLPSLSSLHLSISSVPPLGFLSHSALSSPGKMERRRERKDQGGRGDSGEKSDSSLRGRGWGLFFFFFFPSLVFYLTIQRLSQTHTHAQTHCRGLCSSPSSCVSLRVLSFTHTQLRSACPYCLTARLYVLTHTHTHLQGNTGIYTDRKYLSKIHCKAKQTCKDTCWFAKAAYTPVSVLKQAYCFCPACDRESAFCLNYRAALWILSTTHILSRHCSEKQTHAHTEAASRPTDISETFF